MSDRPYPGDDAIMVSIYDHFRVSMFDAERWFGCIKADEIERLSLNHIHTCHDNCQKIECVQRREIERLTTELSISESNFAESVDRHLKDVDEIERLRSALEKYGEHMPSCCSQDKMDSGERFTRHDWPCDCGFREALKDD